MLKGRRELGAYIDRCDLALGDSEFNRIELEGLGFPRTGVLPVVPDFSHLDATPDFHVAGAFDDEWTNLLFVGRMIPNKRIENVIRIFHAYRTRINPRSRLLLVGSYGGFEKYLAMLQGMIGALGTPDVHFAGHVSNEELAAYYEVADLFCARASTKASAVPLVEASTCACPSSPMRASAVPATLDGGGVLYQDRDPGHVALVADAVLSDHTLQERVLAAQDAALDRLVKKDFGGTLLSFVDQSGRRPRIAPPG